MRRLLDSHLKCGIIMAMKNNSKYHQNCEILLAHIYNLCHYGRLKKCTATTERLAQAFEQPISDRQIYRYLKTLKDAKLIEVSTSKLKKDGKTKSLYKTREILVKGPEPKLSKTVSRTSVKVHTYSVSKKKVVISDKKAVVKTATVPKPVAIKKTEVKYVAPTPTLPQPDDNFWRKMDEQMEKEGYYRKVHQFQNESFLVRAENPSLSFEEACEVAKEQYNQGVEMELQMKAQAAWEEQQRRSSIDYIRAVGGDVTDMDNVVEEAWRLHLEQKDQYLESLEVLENEEKREYSKEEWAKIKQQRLQEEMAIMANDLLIKDEEFWLKVSPNGVIIREVKLFDYVNWGPDSQEFKVLKQEYAKIR